MKRFGINEFTNNSAILKKHNTELPSFFEFDFSNNPDLVPGFITLCACKKVPFRFTGISTLQYKESDRIKALETELEKIGIQLDIGENTVQCSDFSNLKNTDIIFDTHNDHRIAMSLSAVACLYPDIKIKNPETVIKSYPSFWNDLGILQIEF